MSTDHAIEFIGAFESTYMPAHDCDVLETTGHVACWREDLELLTSCGVRRVRYPIRWHRVEPEAGRLDWSFTDETLDYFRSHGLVPIVDLVHHTSYPAWLTGGFGDPRFGAAYLRYCEAFATRYPWISEYTLLNEPFATLFLAGHQGIWPPYGAGMQDFVQLVRNVLPAVAEAARMYRSLLPGARHVWVDTCEAHTGRDAEGTAYASFANDRRFFVLDAFVGKDLDGARPFIAEVVAAGGEELLELDPAPVDVLGIDYYAHSEWHFTALGGHAPSPVPRGLCALALEYYQRYGLEMILSETNIRGWGPDRATWLKYTLEHCEMARSAGVPLTGFCWFPFIDSMDWDSLLAVPARHIDPVGVFLLDEELRRQASSMSRSYAAAACGAPSAELPAYKLQPPLDQCLAGFLSQLDHWEWQEAPAAEIGAFMAEPRTATVGAADGSLAR